MNLGSPSVPPQSVVVRSGGGADLADWTVRSFSGTQDLQGGELATHPLPHPAAAAVGGGR